MVREGLQFLEGASDGRFGAKCLVGLSFLKAGQFDGPKVEEALKECQKFARYKPQELTTNFCDIYSTGLAVVFLCALDASKYRSEIQTFIRSLEIRQLPQGAWGYDSDPQGDTSMTQYAALAMWEASHHGIPISYPLVARTADWLLRTQDISGGWGYHPTDPDNHNLLEQTNVRLSLTAAALGSLYICTDLLGLSAASTDRKLPPALRPVNIQRRGAGTRRAAARTISRKALRRAFINGNIWMRVHYEISPTQYTHYYLYALERYHSFRADAGIGLDAKGWYDDGVEYLAKNQHGGGWQGQTSADVDSAFSILFLLRSTQQSIRQARGLGNGQLRGGRGFPSNTDNAEVKDGKLFPRRLAGPGQSLLKTLSNPNDSDLYYLSQNLEVVDRLSSDKNAKSFTDEEVQQLRQLLGVSSPMVRLVSIRALANKRELDNVPRLIHALSDPSWRVVLEAHRALQFTSRKLIGIDLPQEVNEQKRAEAIEKWKRWYLAIHPEAILAD